MAKALQCPACGTKRMADTLAGIDSFPCGTCGKVLKVPPSLTAPDGAPAPEPTTPASEPDPVAPRERAAPPAMVVASTAAAGSVPPPPRRRRRSADAPDAPVVAAEPVDPAPVAAVAAVSDDEPVPDPVNTVPISAVAAGAAGGAVAGAAGRRMVSSASPAAATAVAPESLAEDAPAPRTRARRSRASGADTAPDALPVVFRILIWIVALPIGLALVGIPARKAGYLSSQKLLDVVIKHNLDRFFPLAVIVVLWALVTAIVVQLLAEGGRAWRHKRRLEHEAATRPKIVSSSPGVTPPPRRVNGNSNGNAGGDTGGNGAPPPQRQSRAGSRGGS
jgi:hypothetical protein